MEVILIGVTAKGVRDERPEVHQGDHADEHAHDAERAHAYLLAEKSIEAFDHGMSLSGLRKTVVVGSRMLNQVVTVASK